MTEITVDDALALQAFVEALAKLEASLEEGLVEDINAVGKCLKGDRSQLIALILLQDFLVNNSHQLLQQISYVKFP